ncbi:MAG: DegV family protein [Dehalococcoidia bacterium]|nr:DegV family protein [Dehalococcoidia bacterium]
MPVRIVTDSTADLPPQVAAELGIRVMPLYVHFGEKVYRDGIDLTAEEFYPKLVANKTLPTTSTVAPVEFARMYDELSKETREILAITISSKLSAAYDVALQARELIKDKKCRVEVMDSKLFSMALGLVVIGAAKRAREGANLDSVLEYARGLYSRIHVRMTFDTLEYVRKGGRIGAAEAFMGRMLDVKPILTLKDGMATPVVRRRTRAKAIEYLRRFAVGFREIADLAVAYTTKPEDAIGLVNDLDEVFPKERTYLSVIGPVLGTHLGPGALGIAVVEPER